MENTLAAVAATTTSVAQQQATQPVAQPPPSRPVESVASQSGARASRQFDQPANSLERSARQYLALLEITGDAGYAAAQSGWGGNFAQSGGVDTYA